MSSRAILLAACVVARDARTDAAATLDAWAREAAVPLNALVRTAPLAVASVLDDFATQAFVVAAARNARPGFAAACHMGTRVNGRGDDQPVIVSERSIEGARRLAEAANDGQLLVSGDLGAYLTIGGARLAPFLDALRIRLPDGTAMEAYRVRAGAIPAPPRSRGNGPPIEVTSRSHLLARLGPALMPFLGPIAPVLLRRLPAGPLSTREFVEMIVREIPDEQRDQARRVIEEEIRRLR